MGNKANKLDEVFNAPQRVPGNVQESVGCGTTETVEQLLSKCGFEYPRCGVDLPPGWTNIVRDMLPKLRDKCRIVQLKVKFGELRVYVDPIPGIDGDGLFPFEREVNEAINEATIASNKICEVCGAPGKRYSDGWSAVYCEPHREERLEERRRYGKR